MSVYPQPIRYSGNKRRASGSSKPSRTPLFTTKDSGTDSSDGEDALSPSSLPSSSPVRNRISASHRTPSQPSSSTPKTPTPSTSKSTSTLDVFQSWVPAKLPPHPSQRKLAGILSPVMTPNLTRSDSTKTEGSSSSDDPVVPVPPTSSTRKVAATLQLFRDTESPTPDKSELGKPKTKDDETKQRDRMPSIIAAKHESTPHSIPIHRPVFPRSHSSQSHTTQQPTPSSSTPHPPTRHHKHSSSSQSISLASPHRSAFPRNSEYPVAQPAHSPGSQATPSPDVFDLSSIPHDEIIQDHTFVKRNAWPERRESTTRRGRGMSITQSATTPPILSNRASPWHMDSPSREPSASDRKGKEKERTSVDLRRDVSVERERSKDIQSIGLEMRRVSKERQMSIVQDILDDFRDFRKEISRGRTWERRDGKHGSDSSTEDEAPEEHVVIENVEVTLGRASSVRAVEESPEKPTSKPNRRASIRLSRTFSEKPKDKSAPMATSRPLTIKSTSSISLTPTDKTHLQTEYPFPTTLPSSKTSLQDDSTVSLRRICRQFSIPVSLLRTVD